MNVFECNDYKAFLRQDIRINREKRGYQGVLARAAGCQRSYLSQVLNGPYDLTREHAAGLCDYWGFDDEESECFVCMVDFARAASASLRRVVGRRLSLLKKSRANLARRIDRHQIQDHEAETFYYSSWYWSAIHLLLTIPEFSTVPAIAERLQLPRELVQDALRKLEEMKLVQRGPEGWKATEKNIHLPETSIMREAHHTGWRQRAIQNIQLGDKAAVHFSSVFSLSRKDYGELRELVMSFLLQARAMIEPSKEEELYSLNCDLFRV